MESSSAGVVKQETPEAEFLFAEVADKAVGPHGETKSATQSSARTAARVLLWLILGGVCFMLWQGFHEASAVREAGAPPYSYLLLHEPAEILLLALVLTRLARRWMGFGTTVSLMEVRGKNIHLTPKWDAGTVWTSTADLAKVEVVEPAFGAKTSRMTLVERGNRRHTIRHLSDDSRLEDFAAFCAGEQIVYERFTASRVKEAIFFASVLLLALVWLATANPTHPFRTILEYALLLGIALVLRRLRRQQV